LEHLGEEGLAVSLAAEHPVNVVVGSLADDDWDELLQDLASDLLAAHS